MSIISIHQPHYHYWIGLLHKIASSDIHVILDDVQYRKRNFQNRVKINSNSASSFLSVPVNSKGHQTDNLKIKDVLLSEPEKLHKQFLTLKHTYCKTPGWKHISDSLESLYQRKYSHLIDLNLALLKLYLELFKINTPMVKSSSLGISSNKNQRILDICLATDAKSYISGKGAQSYMHNQDFEDKNIEVILQNFDHPTYRQFERSEFNQGCLALDWYFHNPDESIAYFEHISNKS